MLGILVNMTTMFVKGGREGGREGWMEEG